jgi:hypothetical protein
VRLQRVSRAAERQRTDVRAHTGQAQHETSLRRRAEVRAAPAEQSAAGDSPTGE